MPIIADVRPHAHTTPPNRRLVAGYIGTVAGLRAALARALTTAGGAR
ncbi:hypothetical protein AB0C02_28235 [Micromonospora sp. NPDC048999]